MKNKILILFAFASLLFSYSCSTDILDRPPLHVTTDDEYWTSEDRLRLFANGFYNNADNIGLFQGYSRSWTAYYVPVRALFSCDDFATGGTQPSFATTNSGSVSYWQDGLWQGRGWYWSIIRRVNVFVNRINTRTDSWITPEQYNHWMGIARFFRALEYYELVKTYGDVPWFEDEILETERDLMYKDRDSREFVADKIYDDLKYALANVRISDGTAGVTVTRYVVAGYISRLMLWEGTWQWYHNGNTALAKKYLDFAVEAAEFVMNSGNYDIDAAFHSLFGSDVMPGKECLLYRAYSATSTPTSVTHCIASYCNTAEAQDGGANLSLLKSFICNDGKVWQNSGAFTDAGITLANEGEKFRIENLIHTRDPRFEATFYHQYKSGSPTLLYCNKFIDRIGTEPGNPGTVPKYSSMTNTNAAPVMRLGEVLLNFIEAKAVLAAHLGGTTVAQSDIDKSINALRNRPIDAIAESRGVKKTAPLLLSNMPNDPDREADVPELIWEIRRERRMELIFEATTRLHDLRRWKKLLQYMNTGTAANTFPDIMCSMWVNWNHGGTDAADPGNIMGARLASTNDDGDFTNAGIIGVRHLDGTVVMYDGTNAADLVGFIVANNPRRRTQEAEERHYLAPVPNGERINYDGFGYTLSQNPGW